MPDIFISYSRKDSEQAQLLTELLTSAGLSVWIDQSGIGAATSWSGEISRAITDCRALIVLLSPSSVDSKNVTREVALAFERNKKILPIDIEPVMLPDDFAYHLAGLQRSSMTNIDSVIRALGKLGLEATGAPQPPKIVKQEGDRKSLIVLPFEDLSPTRDNDWFADGLASELVSVLSNVKSLKLIDWNTSKMLKNKSIKTVEIAHELNVRYFIEGQVRKFGDQIKISVTLLDIETGDHLWQDSLRGTMQDIFDIQEQTAQKVVDGLKLHLTRDEKKGLAKRGTENAEAYELYLKGSQYYNRHTKGDYERSIGLHEEAARLDPRFCEAFSSLALSYIEIYRIYDRNPAWLARAEAATLSVRAIEGESPRYLCSMSRIAERRSDPDLALRFAQRAVDSDPKSHEAWDVLAQAYAALGNLDDAARAGEEGIRLLANSTSLHFNLLIFLSELGDVDRLRQAAARALPVFEKHLRLSPDDHSARVAYASVLSKAGRMEEALRVASTLVASDVLDAYALYNVACLYLRAGDAQAGLRILRRGVEKGLREVDLFRHDPDLKLLRDPASPFHAEFVELLKELEEKNA